MQKPLVIKIGGSTLGSYDTTIEDVVELQRRGKALVIVHGGGKLITEWLDKQGIASRFEQGERVTDQPTLEVVTSVLAGLVNKDIVAAINGLGGRAAGISGVDGALIEGRIKDSRMGYVGEVTRVNIALVKAMLESGFVPVIAPVGFNPDGSAGAPRTLNFNADFIAGEVAAAAGAETLVFLTDVAGILDGSGKLLARLTPGQAESLMAAGVASGGMIPKLKSCIRALDGTGSACIIDGRLPHALLRKINGELDGTTICR